MMIKWKSDAVGDRNDNATISERQLYVQIMQNHKSLFRPLVPRIVEVEHNYDIC